MNKKDTPVRAPKPSKPLIPWPERITGIRKLRTNDPSDHFPGVGSECIGTFCFDEDLRERYRI